MRERERERVTNMRASPMRSPLAPMFLRSKKRKDFFNDDDSSTSEDEEEIAYREKMRRDREHGKSGGSSSGYSMSKQATKQREKSPFLMTLGNLRIRGGESKTGGNTVQPLSSFSIQKKKSQQKRVLKCPRCKKEFQNIPDLTRHAVSCRGWESSTEAMKLLEVDPNATRIVPTVKKTNETIYKDDEKEVSDSEKSKNDESTVRASAALKSDDSDENDAKASTLSSPPDSAGPIVEIKASISNSDDEEEKEEIERDDDGDNDDDDKFRTSKIAASALAPVEIESEAAISDNIEPDTKKTATDISSTSKASVDAPCDDERVVETKVDTKTNESASVTEESDTRLRDCSNETTSDPTPLPSSQARVNDKEDALKEVTIDDSKSSDTVLEDETSHLRELRQKVEALQQRKQDILKKMKLQEQEDEKTRREAERLERERERENAKCLEEKRQQRLQLKRELEALQEAQNERETKRLERERDRREKLRAEESRLLEAHAAKSAELQKLQEDEDKRIAEKRRRQEQEAREAEAARARRFREEQEREEAEMEELRKQIEACRKRERDSKHTEAKADEVTAKTLTRTKELEKMLSDLDIAEAAVVTTSKNKSIAADRTEDRTADEVVAATTKTRDGENECDRQQVGEKSQRTTETDAATEMSKEYATDDRPPASTSSSPRKKNAAELKLEKLRARKKRKKKKKKGGRLLERAASVSMTTPKRASEPAYPCAECESCGGYTAPTYAGVFNAASYGHTKCLTKYLSEGLETEGRDVMVAWLNRENEYGTALHFASAYGHAESVLALLEYGADPRCRDLGQQRTALIYASASNQFNCSAILIQAAPNSLDDIDVQGNGALHLAASYGHIEITQLLLSSAANPDLQNNEGDTPAHMASSVDILSTLFCEHGANLYVVNYSDRTVLFTACANNLPACAQFIIEADDADEGLLLNHPDFRQDTPLHAAACNGNIECVAVLLRNGADPNLKNASGLTPHALAKLGNFQSCADLIAKYEGVGHAMLEAESAARRRRSSVKENEDVVSAKADDDKRENAMSSIATVAKLKVRAGRARKRRFWQQILDKDSGYFYYFNRQTGETRWEAPKGFFAQEEGDEETTASQSETKVSTDDDSSAATADIATKGTEIETKTDVSAKSQPVGGTKNVEKKSKYILMAEEYSNQRAFLKSSGGDGDEEGKTTKKITCTICQVGTVTRIFMPCEHVCCCDTCIETLGIGGDSGMECPCPLCMVPIASVEDIQKQSAPSRSYGPAKKLPAGFAEKFKRSAETLCARKGKSTNGFA